jgi:hypothetical protein
METQKDGKTSAQVLVALGATRSHEYAPVLVNGAEWTFHQWHTGDEPPYLSRRAAGGNAAVHAVREGGFRLHMQARPYERCLIESSSTHDSLEAAAAAAESFQWKTVEHVGRTWYVTERPSSTDWTTCLGPGQMAKITRHAKHGDGGFSPSREITPQHGETYEINCLFYRSGDSGGRFLSSFEEAAAVALTLPVFVAAMMTQGEESAWPAVAGPLAVPPDVPLATAHPAE